MIIRIFPARICIIGSSVYGIYVYVGRVCEFARPGPLTAIYKRKKFLQINTRAGNVYTVAGPTSYTRNDVQDRIENKFELFSNARSKIEPAV